jgi:adenylate kinase family enzyme
MKLDIYTYVSQGSADWLNLRLGRIGASSGQPSVLLTKSPPDKLSVGGVTMLYKKWAERITGKSADTDFKSYAMERGNQLEDTARQVYINRSGNRVVNVGYMTFGDYVGYSPDGLILKETAKVGWFTSIDDCNGLVEIKCPELLEYTRLLDGGEIKSQHIDQMQWGMWVTGFSFCDYVVYNPDFVDNPMLIIRVERDDDTIKVFEEKIKVFESEMDRLTEIYKNM